MPAATSSCYKMIDPKLGGTLRDGARRAIMHGTGNETMRTYVAEINGEALIAFRAEGDNDAYHIVNETNGDLRLGLNGFFGLVRVDGNPLWDGETEIKVRPATGSEDKIWLDARDAEFGEGKLINPSMGDDPDALNVYLIATSAVEETAS
jgi:hypothetical protein